MEYTVQQATCPKCGIRASESPFALCSPCREKLARLGLITAKVFAVQAGWILVGSKTTWAQFDQLRDALIAHNQKLEALPKYAWGEWPEHLLTKKQMGEAGFQTGDQLPFPVAKVSRNKSPDGWMYLYDRNQGVAKKPISAEQKAKRETAQIERRAKSRCQQCGERLRNWRTGPLCSTCSMKEEDKANAVAWAQAALNEPEKFVILDTETTGLDADRHEIIQIALIDMTGAVLLDTLVKALHPERMYEGDGRCAFDVHGIGAERLTDAPTWGEVMTKLQVLTADKVVLIYNADFDIAMIAGMCERHDIQGSPGWVGYKCVMKLYAEFVGEWSNYHEDYRWQPLNGGHSALSDCQATLGVIREMAKAGNELESEGA